jgi:3-hexulose-6-phosphate synthase
MKLQLAMDMATLDKALGLARLVAEYVDIIELGSPLIKNEGMAAISAIKASYPDKTVCADMKTAHAGELEAELAFGAGADLVTVLGAADDDTIMGAVVSARRHGKGVVADMIAVPDRVARARDVVRMGVEFCEIHAAFDERSRRGYSVQALIEAGRRSEVPFSVSGGVTVNDVRDVQTSGALIAVVGAAIYGAADPRAAARGLRAAIEPPESSWLVEVPAARKGLPHGVPRGAGPGKAADVRVLARGASR